MILPKITVSSSHRSKMMDKSKGSGGIIDMGSASSFLQRPHGSAELADTSQPKTAGAKGASKLTVNRMQSESTEKIEVNN